MECLGITLRNSEEFFSADKNEGVHGDDHRKRRGSLALTSLVGPIVGTLIIPEAILVLPEPKPLTR